MGDISYSDHVMVVVQEDETGTDFWNDQAYFLPYTLIFFNKSMLYYTLNDIELIQRRVGMKTSIDDAATEGMSLFVWRCH